MARVRAANVDFSYPVYEVTGRSLKVSMVRQFAGSAIGAEKGMAEVHALRDISFDLKAGDRVGIIGRNGSGKSTLLRLIAGLAYPRRGQLDIEGRVVSLITPGIGVNQDLSGAANIELPLRLLGATDAEVTGAKHDVPDFTGLGDFMKLPVRTYSDGMKARLAFALSTAIDADVLVLDEWLGAGDAAFIEKAQARMNGIVSRAQILVLATHSVQLVLNVCNLCIWLDGGRLCMMGPPATVVNAYLASYQHAIAAE
jgi:ABC-2 type transport system ATP-binding protein/lipopolysaccharide transport system ATP-binding protein